MFPEHFLFIYVQMTKQKNLLMKYLFIVLLLIGYSCGQKNNSCSNIPAADEDNGGLVLPEGFSALVVAEETGKGRHIVVNQNGDIYVSLRGNDENKGIVCLRDTTGDDRADLITYTGNHVGTGIGLHKGYLYFGADTAIV